MANEQNLLQLPKNLQDLTKRENVALLNQELKRLVNAVNQDRWVDQMPVPENFESAGGAGYAVLGWDDVPDELRPSLDGARIWKADASIDPREVFSDNEDKGVLVSCVRTTKYLDVEVSTGTWLYWVQWVNLNGEAGGVAGAEVVDVI
jgi:hypothetical protein